MLDWCVCRCKSSYLRSHLSGMGPVRGYWCFPDSGGNDRQLFRSVHHRLWPQWSDTDTTRDGVTWSPVCVCRISQEDSRKVQVTMWVIRHKNDRLKIAKNNFFYPLKHHFFFIKMIFFGPHFLRGRSVKDRVDKSIGILTLIVVTWLEEKSNFFSHKNHYTPTIYRTTPPPHTGVCLIYLIYVILYTIYYISLYNIYIHIYTHIFLYVFMYIINNICVYIHDPFIIYVCLIHDAFVYW